MTAEFILVHGGAHGAWCWELLEKELRLLGHRTHVMDLPVDRPGIGVDAYAAAALASIDGKAGDGAYVVGHSMAGLVIPRIALQRKVAGLIFLCALVAATNVAEHEANLAAFVEDTDRGGMSVDASGCLLISPARATATFYHDVPPELRMWATAKLRPQWLGATADLSLIAQLPSVPMHSIVCRDDRALRYEYLRHLLARRLGVEPFELPGGHSPFLSRPRELAAVLDRLAR
jgi:pimeloyl-ACP methyl ester carboxylesterase